MPIIDGEDVKAAVINRAKLDRESNDIAVGIIGLQNAAPVSGANIANIQALMNANRLATGADETDDTVATNYGTPNIITNGTSHKTALIALDAAAGGGGILKQARWLKSTALVGTTGGSRDVTSVFSAETPSTNPSTEGVVVNDPENKIFVQNVGGIDSRDVFRDAFGNIVYGKLTEAAGTWTLTFFVDDDGIETAYSFPGAVDMVIYYQKIFNLATNVPQYDTVLWEIFGDRLGGGGGPSTAEEIRAGSITLTTGTSERAVSFSSPMDGSNIQIFAFLANLTDPSPQIHPVTITALSSNGFTAKWSANLDSSNYMLCYIAQRNNGDFTQTGFETLGLNDDTVVVTITDVGSENYSICTQLVNTVDGAVQVMPLIVSDKQTGQFTVSFPAGVDSTNYRLHWMISEHANPTGRQASEALGSGISQKAVTFADIGSTNWAVALTFVNEIEGAGAQIQAFSNLAKNTDGFTAFWSANTDTANYALEYVVREHA